jgi:hypothetical protein
MGYGNRDYAAALEGLATGQMTGLEDLVTKKIRLGEVVEDGLLPLLANNKAEGKPLDTA